MASHDRPSDPADLQVTPSRVPDSGRASMESEGASSNAPSSDRVSSRPATPHIIPATPVLAPLDLGEAFDSSIHLDLEAGSVPPQAPPTVLTSFHQFRRAGPLFREALPHIRSIDNIFSSRSSTRSVPPPYEDEPPRYSVGDRPPPGYFTLYMPINVTAGREVRVHKGWCATAMTIILAIACVTVIVMVGTWRRRDQDHESEGDASGVVGSRLF
jgi:hypothetical protein